MAEKIRRSKAQKAKNKRTRDRINRRRNVARELAGADYDYLDELRRGSNVSTDTDSDDDSVASNASGRGAYRITIFDVIRSWLPRRKRGVKYRKRYKFTQQAKMVMMVSGVVCLGVLTGGGYLINWLNENYSDTSTNTSSTTTTISAEYAYTGLSRTQVKTIEATGKFDRFLLIDGVPALSVYDDVITTEDAAVLRSRDQLDETGIIYNGLGYNETDGTEDSDDTSLTDETDDGDDTSNTTSTYSSSNFTWSGQFNALFLNAGSTDDDEDTNDTSETDSASE